MADTTILVVDDSVIDRRLAGRILEKQDGYQAIFATDGHAALEAIEEHSPQVVITDLLMPGMDGLELVAESRKRHPELPVVLMTAHGSEETAVKALASGASSYVPKRLLAKQLVETLETVLEVTRGVRDEKRVYELLLERGTMRYELGNEPAALTALVRHLEGWLVTLGICDASERIQVGVALREALVNAVDHGSLELDSRLKDEGPDAYQKVAAKRREESPYKERSVGVETTLEPNQITFVVRDAGPGFDPHDVPDPADPLNLERLYGRGLLLIRAFMDEVTHNERGNEITMIKRKNTGKTV